MKLKNFQLIVILFSTFLYVGCANNSTEDTGKPLKEEISAVAKEPSQDSTIVRVYVDKDSQIKVNGKLVSLSELDTLLQQVQQKAGVVYYSRYNAQEYEGPQASLRVIDVVVKYQLPLRFYTDSTFSKVVPIN